jgi:hypothetical protein
MAPTDQHLQCTGTIYDALIGCSFAAIALISLCIFLGASSCN